MGSRVGTATPTGSASAVPFVVRIGRVAGWWYLGFGLMEVALLVVDRDQIGSAWWEWIRWFGLFCALLWILFGLRVLRNPPSLTILPDRVEIWRPWPVGTKTIPIDGVDDLEVKWKYLYRRHDDRKIARLGPLYADQADVHQLQSVLRP